MSETSHESGALPTHGVTKHETVVLVRSLLVDWKVLEHLESKGVTDKRVLMDRAAAGCCKPDGGTCCVNAKPA